MHLLTQQIASEVTQVGLLGNCGKSIYLNLALENRVGNELSQTGILGNNSLEVLQLLLNFVQDLLLAGSRVKRRGIAALKTENLDWGLQSLKVSKFS